MPDGTFARFVPRDACERSIRHSFQRVREAIGVVLIVLEMRRFLVEISLRHGMRVAVVYVEDAYNIHIDTDPAVTGAQDASALLGRHVGSLPCCVGRRSLSYAHTVCFDLATDEA